jgi:GTP-binding protein Era
MQFKSGFIGIIGRPNVGKSTLLNAILDEKITIVTHKPQTTRNRIMGIKNVPAGQLIFLDTPGIHSPSSSLNRSMVAAALQTFSFVDLIILMMDAKEGILNADLSVINEMNKGTIPAILVINKIDLVKPPQVLPIIKACGHIYPFKAIIPISAQNGKGIATVIDETLKLLPEGPAYFPDDMITDRSERFIAAEIIREKVLLLTQKEVPYATAVIVDTFKFKDDVRGGMIHIQATIHVEKDSQKGILIGKHGAMIKKIGIAARRDIEFFFSYRVYLELFVKVQKGWSENPRLLHELGYMEK